MEFDSACPYHPASNGEAERAVRTFKQAMKTMKAEPGTRAEKLAWFLQGYRTTPPTATGCTPAELLIGRRIHSRLNILDRLGPVTYHVQVGSLFWKRHVYQFRALASSMMADRTHIKLLEKTPLSFPLSSRELVSSADGSHGPPSGQFNLPDPP